MKEREYDHRQIAHMASRQGWSVVRPNGDRRTRGSRRLFIVDPKNRNVRLYAFTAVENNGLAKIVPMPIIVPGL